MPLGVSFDFKIFVTLPVHSLRFTLAFEAVSSPFSVAPTLSAACCHASPPPVSYHSSRKETNPAAAESTLQSLRLQAQM